MATIGRRAYAEMFGPTVGDRLRLTRGGIASPRSREEADAQGPAELQLACTLPEVFGQVHPGERVLFDRELADRVKVAQAGGAVVVDARTGEVEEVAPGRGYRAIAHAIAHHVESRVWPLVEGRMTGRAGTHAAPPDARRTQEARRPD